MAAKPKPPPALPPDVKLPAEKIATDAFPADEDVSIPPPGSDRTVGTPDPETARKGRPHKPD